MRDTRRAGIPENRAAPRAFRWQKICSELRKRKNIIVSQPCISQHRIHTNHRYIHADPTYRLASWKRALFTNLRQLHYYVIQFELNYRDISLISAAASNATMWGRGALDPVQHIVDDGDDSALCEKYEILRSIGEGNRSNMIALPTAVGRYGTVIKCKNRATGAHVAVKRLSLAQNAPAFNLRTLREIRILRRIRHEHVVNML
jgi:hypothetical protein